MRITRQKNFFAQDFSGVQDSRTRKPLKILNKKLVVYSLTIYASYAIVVSGKAIQDFKILRAVAGNAKIKMHLKRSTSDLGRNSLESP